MSFHSWEYLYDFRDREFHRSIIAHFFKMRLFLFIGIHFFSPKNWKYPTNIYFHSWEYLFDFQDPEFYWFLDLHFFIPGDPFQGNFCLQKNHFSISRSRRRRKLFSPTAPCSDFESFGPEKRYFLFTLQFFHVKKENVFRVEISSFRRFLRFYFRAISRHFNKFAKYYHICLINSNL